MKNGVESICFLMLLNNSSKGSNMQLSMGFFTFAETLSHFFFIETGAWYLTPPPFSRYIVHTFMVLPLLRFFHIFLSFLYAGAELPLVHIRETTFAGEKLVPQFSSLLSSSLGATLNRDEGEREGQGLSSDCWSAFYLSWEGGEKGRRKYAISERKITTSLLSPLPPSSMKEKG